MRKTNRPRTLGDTPKRRPGGRVLLLMIAYAIYVCSHWSFTQLAPLRYRKRGVPNIFAAQAACHKNDTGCLPPPLRSMPNRIRRAEILVMPDKQTLHIQQA